jgi:hypothetical protein
MPPTRSRHSDAQELKIQAAILAWKQGQFTSRRAAAGYFGVRKQHSITLMLSNIMF